MIRATRVPKLMTSVQLAEYMSMDSAFTYFLEVELEYLLGTGSTCRLPRTYVESVISFLVPGRNTL